MKTNAQRTRQGIRIFSTSDQQCVWMKAGVISYRLCDNAFDCTTCAFDRAMSRNMRHKPSAQVNWREAMGRKPFEKRECRHMMSGRVQYKFCANNYQCKVCEFDQYLDDADLAAAPAATPIKTVSGFSVADGYYYHQGHTWARIEHGGFVRVGIDDFALRLLGHPTGMELPRIGSRVDQSAVGWTFHRDEKTAGMLAPVSGMVLAANHKVWKEPQRAKRDPYGEGWLLVLEPKGLKKNLKPLLTDQAASSWVAQEAKKLEDMVMKNYGLSLAATGGEIVDDVFGNLSHLGWENLVHEFLHT